MDRSIRHHTEHQLSKLSVRDIAGHIHTRQQSWSERHQLHTLHVPRTPNVDFLNSQEKRTLDFCQSQNLSAYLFIKQLAHWLWDLDYYAKTTNKPSPIPDVTAVVSQLAPLFTSTPLLANGQTHTGHPKNPTSAQVSPSVTTFTSTDSVGVTITIITSSDTGIPVESTESYDDSTAPGGFSTPQSWAGSISSDSSITETTITCKRPITSLSTATSCHGPGNVGCVSTTIIDCCPTKTGDAVLQRLPTKIWLAGVGSAIIVAAVGV